MTTPEYTDVRLIPMTAEHHAALTSTDGDQLARSILYIVQAYEKAPPMSIAQAFAYSHDVEWWRNEIADL